MEGGITVTDDEELYHVMLSLRAHGWTRNLPQENHVIEKSNDPFMESFRFVLPGYNLRPLEMSGAIGQAQLRKVDDIIAGRRRNAVTFQNLMKEIPEIMIQREIGESSWFGFSIVLPEWCDRAPVLDVLREAGIETRPIVAGNFTLNPVIEYLDHSIHGPLDAANKIHEQGFFVGNHHYDISEQLGHFANLLKTCLDDQRQ
jgi:CDP-6-deoxy-D-xylo-4-hexulose-3-dehydrase